jgi:chaperonin GroEL
LEEPIRIIAQNAGLDGAVVAEEVKKRESGFGFNAQTMKYEDLMSAGIVDPKKVVRSALQHAASAASMFLTTECIVAEKKEEKSAGTCAPMPGGMPGMGGF